MSKPGSSQTQWSRADYRWYLEGDYRKQFSRDRWWQPKENAFMGKGAITRLTAAYELIRRHPDFKDLHGLDEQGRPDDGVANALSLENDPHQGLRHFLWHHGLKPWNKLTQEERKWFREVVDHLPTQRGCDFRVIVADLTTKALQAEPQAAVPLTVTEPSTVTDSDETRRVMELSWAARASSIAKLAAEHDREGYVILAVRADAANREGVLEFVKQAMNPHWKRSEIGRSHESAWLGLVEDFEKLPTGAKDRDDDVARKYQELVNGFVPPLAA